MGRQSAGRVIAWFTSRRNVALQRTIVEPARCGFRRIVR
jgi:hypothetical protein